MIGVHFCVFKQKTAYDLRISDLSSDVCASDLVAFVVLKRSLPQGDEAVAIAKQLRDWVAKEIGPIAKPRDIRFGENLPKTRSGKIMRRLLRIVAKGETVTQDVSTLENPAILDQSSEEHQTELQSLMSIYYDDFRLKKQQK